MPCTKIYFGRFDENVILFMIVRHGVPGLLICADGATTCSKTLKFNRSEPK